MFCKVSIDEISTTNLSSHDPVKVGEHECNSGQPVECSFQSIMQEGPCIQSTPEKPITAGAPVTSVPASVVVDLTDETEQEGLNSFSVEASSSKATSSSRPHQLGNESPQVKLKETIDNNERPTDHPAKSHIDPNINVFDSQPMTCPVVIELFAGSGRVTAQLKHIGVKAAFGVDHKNLSKIAPIQVCDLSTPEGQKLCMQWCQSPLLAGVFAAPPCGTCSLARSIILRDSLGRRLPGPVPLRSESKPNGLPFLKSTDRARVSSANRLYDFLSRLVEELVQKGVPIVIENPRSSLYWLTTFFQRIKHHFSFTAHQACAYGSKRPKWTALAHTHPRFAMINRCCPGVSKTHVHEEWGFKWNGKHKVFATSEEAAYPMDLAAEIAIAFKEVLQKQNWILEPVGWSHSSFAAMRAITGRQPKASRVPPLVSEHKQFIHVQGPSSSMNALRLQTMARCKQPLSVPADCQSIAQIIPADSQLLRVSEFRSKGGGDMQTIQVWGVPWTESEFVSKAVERGHPRSFRALLPPVLEEALSYNANESCAELMALRAKWFSKWVNRSSQLKVDELSLKNSMPAHLKAILEPKRLLLLAEILKEEGYPDQGVFDELALGTELTGQVPSTGVFDKCFRPAEMCMDQLHAGSGASNKSIFHSVRSSGDSEVDRIVYEKTLEERDSGWLRGPVDFHELPEKAVLSRRFGLKQPNKVRLIDDLSASSINKTVQCSETPRPHTTDVIASVALGLLERCRGEVLGKAFDLKSAYRQLGIRESSLLYSYIACFDPVNRRPVIFQMLAVPFGATRAVYSFLRIARCLWWVGCKCLKFCWTNFYDDFVTFSGAQLAGNTESSVALFFDLLGWQFAREGDKSKPFGYEFSALGIHVSLKNFTRGWVEFGNTDNRISEVCGIIDGVVTSGELLYKDAIRLRGRLQFADGQLFGRLGKLCLKSITEHSLASSCKKISHRCRTLLSMFRKMMESGKPRIISLASNSNWFIFTDACFEPDHPSWRCGLGGILVDSTGRPIQYFSLCLSDEQISSLGGDGKKTIIFEAEMLAVILALKTWQEIIRNSMLVAFIDNNSARDIAISASGRSDSSMALIEVLLRTEEGGAFYPWYARVPSPSNPGDRPSRGETDWLNALGVDRICVSDLLSVVIKEVVQIKNSVK